MKRKTVKIRRSKAPGEGNSKYALKINLQKQGKFGANSPFKIQEGGEGVTLQEFNKRRFRANS